MIINNIVRRKCSTALYIGAFQENETEPDKH